MNTPARVFPYGIKEGGKETWLERTNTSNDLFLNMILNIFICFFCVCVSLMSYPSAQPQQADLSNAHTRSPTVPIHPNDTRIN